jgi:response regulator RpfG family c-di-GMP phosphodiesterase
MRQNLLILARNAKNRETLAIPLRAEGFAVALAGDLSEALQVLHTTAIDTVLILKNSPKDAATHKIRSRLLEECQDSRVVLASRHVSVVDGVRKVRFVFDDHRFTEPELVSFLRAAPTSRNGNGNGNEAPARDQGLQSLLQVIDVLVGLQELSDKHFGGSSHGAMKVARAVAEEMNLADEGVLEVALATLLRDIGKAGVDGQILKEDGVFDEVQLKEMREHVTTGVRLLEHIEFPWKVVPVIRHHHERYDGLGYPDGLKGPEIPLGARILAVVDSYLAMISGRSYRQGRSREEAFEELQCHAGTQFDPEVVEVLIRVVEQQTLVRGPDQKPRVLIAGPDEEFAKLLKFRLLNVGMQVDILKNVESIVMTVRSSPPDLVLAEIRPHEDTAFKVLEQIREDEAICHVPFAFVASNGNRVLKVRALRHGVDDFLVKTENLEELVARVENILAREAARRGSKAPPRRRGITGNLENLSLPDVFQMLALGMKTACVTVQSGETRGVLWFSNGNAVHADTGDKIGVNAVDEMLRWKAGNFSIEHGIEAEEQTIDMDTMFLLMECLRKIDEEVARAAGILQ